MKNNQRKAGTILSYVYLFLSNTISLLYTPINLNMLGQSEYGLIATANSLTSYLSLLSMGIGGSYIRFLMHRIELALIKRESIALMVCSRPFTLLFPELQLC